MTETAREEPRDPGHLSRLHRRACLRRGQLPVLAVRLATVYLAEHPGDALLQKLGFREEAAGANTWLVVPNDAGVFHGADAYDAVRCVHPVQVYLDLLTHPERAKEAAEYLRASALVVGPSAGAPHWDARSST